jgi:octaprenyl-diphosphate synthase
VTIAGTFTKMNYSQILNPIKNELLGVESGLQQFFRTDDRYVSQNVLNTLNAGGKRLRPALLLTAAKMCDNTGNKAIRMAVVVELLHMASLIHDDVIDGHQVRRGVATVNSRIGNAKSVLVGDYLYSKAIEILANEGNVELIRCVTSTANRLARGELIQLQVLGDSTLTEEKYVSIIADKTASLFSCACQVGAMLGPSSNGAADCLANYGYYLGMAFQIADDLLDYTGTKENLGKPIGNDIREGKVTLPLIYTIRVADKKDRQWIERNLLVKNINEGTIKRMRSMVDHYNGIGYTIRKAQEYVALCKDVIDKLGQSEIAQSLTSFADYSVYRVS